MGVAGIIAPWNSPVALTIRSLAPALAAGCTAVIKLPGQVAQVAHFMAKIMAEATDLPKSQILAAQHDCEAAMNCLTEALTVARAQSALAWELRSTMVLARMLCEDGQRDHARHALALVYGRFPEGFETADLKLARALLEDLRSSF
jgi:predicted ATPase